MTKRSIIRWEAGAEIRLDQRPKYATGLEWSLAAFNAALAADDGRAQQNGHSVPSHLTHFASLEQGATELRTWETLAISGLLQTASYATAVESTSLMASSSEEVARRVEFRLARQAVLYREPEPLRLYALLDHSVLLRTTGDEGVMSAQIDHLQEMADLPNVDIRVTPLNDQVFAGPGTFRLISGPSLVPYIATTENLAGVQYLESPSVVSAYAALFEHLWSRSLALPEVQRLDRQR